VLKACLADPHIARSSQTERPHSLRYGPFNSCSIPILLFKFLRVLTSAILLYRFVQLFRFEIYRPPSPLRARTLSEVWADAAIRPCKLRVDEIIPAPIHHLFPA